MTADRTRQPDHEPGTVDSGDLPVVLVNDAAAAYPDEWIFMMVTEKDRRGHSVAGKVLLHHRNRKALADATVALLGEIREAPPDALSFYTYKGPRFDSHAEWEAYKAQDQAAHDSRP